MPRFGTALSIAICCCFLSSSISPLVAEKPRWTLEAIMAMKTVADPQISPDGLEVAYVVRSANFQRKAYDSEIWTVSVAGRQSGRLAPAHFSDSKPRWSPAGRRLAFLSRRDGTAQVYSVETPTGQARKLTQSPTGVTEFKWSPDGSQIGFLDVEPLTPEERKRIEGGDDPIVANQNDKRSRLSVVPSGGGVARTITTGRHVTGFDWSPDGSKVVYAAQLTPRNRDTFNVDLYELDLKTNQENPLVVQPGRDADPGYSPDGRFVAFHSQAGSLNYFDERHVGIVPAGGGDIRYVTRSLPADVFRGGNEFWWSHDGAQLVFGAGAGTQDHLYVYHLKQGTGSRLIESLAGPSSYSASRDRRRIAFLKSSQGAPPEVFLAEQMNSQWSQVALSKVNAHVAALPETKARTLRWKSKDGTGIEGVLRLPFGHRPGQRVPLLVELHGGPTGVALEGFPSSRTYPIPLFLHEGFAVLAPNFRGSSNYGAKLRLANIESQGFGDFEDVMSGVDVLIEQGVADPDRLGVMGWSYGGFLSAWIIGHSDRFKAASIGAPGCDWISWYGASDGPREVMWTYFGGKPWDKSETYNRHSPRYSLKNAKTPSLLLHGERDIDDVAEIFQALTDLNVPVEFVTYPREGHGIIEPAHQRDLMRRNLAWFRRWLGKEQ
jgi:dipeptidyl aminopeptidase/acylaminoacyl peptidase